MLFLFTKQNFETSSSLNDKTKMFKFFFIFTVCSAGLMWYLNVYHTAKFLEVIKTVPYSSALIDHIHFYLSVSSPTLSSRIGKIKLFTPEELKEYDGENGSKGTYLSILGDVYDVGKGQKHYGPSGPYHVFAGRDASRSFVTGDFAGDGQVDDVLDLSHNELLSLRDWSKFYKNEYTYKGKLVGRFYNDEGKRTEYWEKLQEKFNDAEKIKQNVINDELLFPPCNVEWNAETGTKVWCSKKSGGIERNWTGVPRKLYMVGSESYRCACIDMNEIQNTESPQYARRGHLQLYEHCDPLQHMCFVKE